MFDIFIRRPVLSLVISLLIVLLGTLSFFSLPISQYPDIIPPSVSVRAKYTGANAEVCTKTVAVPLEKAINGVPGMTHMSSVASNNGTVAIEVTFAVGTDPDLAAVAVQNRVATILDELPEEVIRNGVITEKEVNSLLMYVNIVSTDPNLDEKFIYNFADINVLQELKRIDGVGYSEIVSEKDYSMRVWLKPDRMTAYEISTEEIVQAIQEQNVEAAPGKAGESSEKTAQALQYVLLYTGKFNTPEQYENLVLRADEDGSILRLKDVADVEFSSLGFSRISKNNGTPAASILINQRPGSNARDVIQRIKMRMEEIKATSFPPGMTYNYTYDVSRFLDASISEVVKTLFEAIILVSIVVFIFLQDFRSTLIPALAIPVALVGALFFMQVMGFSINLLTLFALVLAIGIVVDNAIVVVEAVHAKMQEEGLPAREATFAAMKEIGGAIIAITLVMSAVFVPVAFLSGPVGVFYRQFSLTLAIAIVISGVNALTLTPALCAILLKNTHHEEKKAGLLQRFFNRFNRAYDGLALRYKNLVGVIAGRRTVTIGLLLIFFAATYGVNAILPTGFIPNEDQGVVYINVTAPSGATVERTEAVLDEIQAVTSQLDIVEATSTLAGYSLANGVSGASFGMGIVNLKSWDERTETVDDVIRILEEKTRHITDASIEYFSPPTVPGFGNSSGFELRVLDRTGSGDLKKLEEVTENFIAALEESPAIDKGYTNYDPNFPQYLIHVDQDMAGKKGVTIDDAMTTLQTLMGGNYASNFVRFGQMYRVMVQAAPEYRAKPEDLLNLYVKNDKGEMVPYSTFIRMERVYGPEQLTRYNMYNSARINGTVAAGFSSGDAIEAIKALAAEKLPRGYWFDWAGMTREEVKSGDQAIYIFIISLVFVYLLLAAQYESFLLPLPVILSLPAGIFGSFLALKIFGLQNNIYAQVALIMLIGLLGKNAILIVEFAIQRRAEGVSVLKAAVEGSVSRLRPILMTSFAFIAGLIPLCIATGAGAMGNRSIGTAAAGGMLIGTIFGVLIIPGLYVLFAGLTVKRERKLKHTLPTLLFLTAIVSGCKVAQPPALPVAAEMPETYIGDTDTLTDGTVRWQNFFSDTLLIDLINTSLTNNFDLLTAVQRVERARANYAVSQGAILPSLNLVGSANVGNVNPNMVGNADQDQRMNNIRDEYFLGLQSSWEVDVWGKLRNEKKAAYARLLASEKGKHLVTTAIVAEIARLYYELLAVDNELEVVRKNIDFQEIALEIINIQKMGGRATELAVQQFTAQLLSTKALEKEKQQRIIELETEINLLMGRYPQPIIRNRDISELVLPPTIHEGVPSTLLLNRPDIQQAELELVAAEADVQAARAAFLPSLTISPYAGFNALDPSRLLQTPESLAAGVLGGITAPIFNKNRIRSEFRRSVAERAEAYYDYQKSIINGYGEVVNSIRGIDNLEAIYALKEEEVEVLLDAVSTSNVLFTSGYASYLEVITAQKSVLEAELELANIKKGIFHSVIDLYRALGGGWSWK